MYCEKCGVHLQDCKGWFTRVNEKGVEGKWVCAPSCDTPQLSNEEALIGAIEASE